jgi:hypothetical protein
MALAKNEPVARKIVWLAWIDLKFRPIECDEQIHARQRATQMSALGAM